MAKSIIDKYSNYEYYIIGAWNSPHMKREVDKERLLSVIQSCRDLLRKPYLRFMWSSTQEEACCVVYDGEDRVTKLIPFSEVEKMIEEGKFHK